MPYTGKFQVFEDIIKEIMIVYKHDSRPWLIGYSGGKDSTLLVSLVYEAMKRLKDAGAKLLTKPFMSLHPTRWLKIPS
ncbi:MAG: hypothetical protein ACLR01_03075 [Vescimonas sp.]